MVGRQRALAPPHTGGIDPPGRYHSAVGLEGPPAPATWELVQDERERERGEGRAGEREGREGRARERERGEERRRERKISQGLADPGARRQMVLRQLDGLRQRHRAVALDPLGRSTG